MGSEEVEEMKESAQRSQREVKKIPNAHDLCNAVPGLRYGSVVTCGGGLKTVGYVKTITELCRIASYLSC